MRIEKHYAKNFPRLAEVDLTIRPTIANASKHLTQHCLIALNPSKPGRVIGLIAWSMRLEFLLAS